MKPTDQQIKKFWEKVDKSTPNECWEWQAALSRGYGKYAKTTAHRFSAIIHGKDMTKPVVRHLCNNPKCVNPNHLEMGTQQENMEDKVISDRHRYKFDRETVIKIQKEYNDPNRTITATDLSIKYGIDRSYMYRLLKYSL